MIAFNIDASFKYLPAIKGKLSYLGRYLSYLRRSVNRHGVHSPFVYDLIEQAFKEKATQESPLEEVRRDFLKDNTELEIHDLGAGSRTGMGAKRSVKDVARASLSSAEQCRILARLVNHLSVEYVLEFGSCLGISAAYMAEAGAKVTSMEGSEALHAIAQDTFAKEGIGPDFRLGDFEDILPGILEEIPKLDMVFFDGNHTHDATLRYFETVLPYVQQNTVLVFDDIHWSTGMESAWEKVKVHEQVTLSIDLFWCGMLFFRSGLSGEHFVIRY